MKKESGKLWITVFPGWLHPRSGACASSGRPDKKDGRTNL